MKLSEIAKIVSGVLREEKPTEINKLSLIEAAQNGDLVFVLEKKFLEAAEQSNASAIVAALGSEGSKPAVLVKNPRLAMAQLLPLFSNRPKVKPGIHKTAIVEKNAKIGKNVSIGPFVYIGENSKIGDNSIIYPNVSVYDNVEIGRNVIVHSGAVLGVDGYGFIPTKEAATKIPQIGKLIIEDDVEIYAGVCIARGALGETVIGQGTKIDNLTHIAHNCKIGKHCLITAQVGFAGSVTFGDHVMVAGQCAFNGHITVGDNCVVLGKSGVTKSIPKNSIVSGFPAQEHKKELREQAKLRRLLEEK